jgi:thiol-disulfide isomerase/thioredoxin
MTRFHKATAVCLLGLVTALGTTENARTATPAPTVKPITAAGLKREIAKRKGKVVLVNLWATWCPPCVASYPDIVKLQRKYGSRGLSVFSISANDPSDVKKSVLPFLKKQKPGFPQFIVAPKDTEMLIKTVDPRWHGELPADVLYGPDGKRVLTIMGEPNTAKLEAKIKQLLKGRHS